MARDYAKTRKGGSGRASGGRKSTASRGRGGTAQAGGGRWRWFLAGLLSGVFLSFMLYLRTLPPADGTDPVAANPEPPVAQPPKPRYDFYTILPEQQIDPDVEPARVTSPVAAGREVYLLQAGSFRQREDADRRRAELLLLGLEPRVEEASSDNGRWFRVYLGPFDSHPEMSRARSLTAAQDIDTLLLKRGGT